jgi:hypothetical protein
VALVHPAVADGVPSGPECRLSRIDPICQSSASPTRFKWTILKGSLVVEESSRTDGTEPEAKQAGQNAAKGILLGGRDPEGAVIWLTTGVAPRQH